MEMTQEDFEKELVVVKTKFVPPSGDLILVSFENDIVRLKVSGLPEDIYKIQGKIVNSGDELRKKIVEELNEKFPELKISLI